MKVAVFLIGLCLFLMAGDRVFAGKHARSCCYARTYHHEVLQEGKNGAYSNPGFGKQASVNKENNYLILDCLEEEETEETFNQKFRLSVKYHSLLSYHSILNYLYNRMEAPPSFGGLVADKYIVQRVLRV